MYTYGEISKYVMGHIIILIILSSSGLLFLCGPTLKGEESEQRGQDKADLRTLIRQSNKDERNQKQPSHPGWLMIYSQDFRNDEIDENKDGRHQDLSQEHL